MAARIHLRSAKPCAAKLAGAGILIRMVETAGMNAQRATRQPWKCSRYLNPNLNQSLGSHSRSQRWCHDDEGER